MKKIRLVVISATIFILSILITNTVFAAPPFLTLAQVQNLISVAIAPVQSALDGLTGRVTTNETSIATQSAQISDLEQRVTALEGGSLGCVEPLSGMLSWWPGDGNANDIVGTNNGTLVNGAAFTPGNVSQAFSFDGLDDFFQSASAGLPTGSSDRTIEFWVKIDSFLDDTPNPSSSLEAFFVGYGNFGSSTQLYALGTAGNVSFFSQWGGAIFGPSLQTDRWYHVAVTNSGNSETLYIDGVAVANGSLTINTPSSTQFYMGRAPSTFGDIRRLDGFLDEVSIYNQSLTLNEIKTIFDAGSVGKCKV